MASGACLLLLLLLLLLLWLLLLSCLLLARRELFLAPLRTWIAPLPRSFTNLRWDTISSSHSSATPPGRSR